jgi:hypothetical protein
MLDTLAFPEPSKPSLKECADITRHYATGSMGGCGSEVANRPDQDHYASIEVLSRGTNPGKPYRSVHAASGALTDADRMQIAAIFRSAPRVGG